MKLVFKIGKYYCITVIQSVVRPLHMLLPQSENITEEITHTYIRQAMSTYRSGPRKKLHLQQSLSQEDIKLKFLLN